MVETFQSLSHSRWDCKYHVVFVPKRRRKTLFGTIRRKLGPMFHELARQKECRIVEGHLLADHVHMCIEIPPKFAVASVVGFLKGKSAIAIAREFRGKQRNFSGRASTSGPAAMPYQRSDSTWSKSRRTFGHRTLTTNRDASRTRSSTRSARRHN